MKGDLYIGRTGEELADAYEVYGICMGDGFLDALTAPLEMKEFVSNESRLSHGREVVIEENTARKNYRELTLSFQINADYGELTAMQSQLMSRRRDFYELLYGIKVDVYVPFLNEYFHLLYKGKSSTHSYAFNLTGCTVTAKFEEPDPDKRGMEITEE